MPLTIGVTSHRNIPAREEAAVRARICEFFAILWNEFPDLPLLVISALAEGGDQWVAEEALAAGARVIAPLPMARAQYAQDFATSASRARFDGLCDQVEIIELDDVDEEAGDGEGNFSPTNERDRRYANAGIYVSAHCHILLAIWDGKETDLLGGTAQIVRYHLSGLKPASLERRQSSGKAGLLSNDHQRLLYHIVCSRDAAGGSPAAPLQPLQTFWRVARTVLPGNGPMPAEFHAMFAQTSEFNADQAKYRVDIDARAARRQDNSGHAAVAPPAALDRLFRAADWLAIHFQRRVLFAMRSLYTLAALMGIAFTVYDNLPAQDQMLYVFLLLFALGGLVVVIANRRGWHRKYLDYRALAEGLRVQSYWLRAGISLTGDPEFARDNFLQKQDVELGWIRNVMRSVALESVVGAEQRPADRLDDVIREWVGDAQQGGQLEYYLRKASQRARTHRVTEAIGVVALCVGIGISVVLALLATRLSADAKNALVVTMAVFSIVAAVREAYAYKKADKELIKQYRFMQRLFADARATLEHTTDPAEQREILRMLGEAALAEHVEWALLHRQRPLEHARF
ncbi:MAG: hypothetical protein ACREPT_08040 [Rudaea sp.]